MARLIHGVLQLNLLYLTGSLSRDGGGLFTALQGLLPALAATGDQVRLHGLTDAGWAFDAATWHGQQVFAHAQRGPRAFGYAPAMRDAVANAPAAVVHCHGLWKYPSVLGRRLQQRRRLPLVVSPHGMLNSQALAVARFKKSIALMAYERAHVMNADCLHALVDTELEAIRRFGYRGPVCVIPNGVTLPDGASLGPAPWLREQSSLTGRTPVLLYLGRKHPIKNLDGLLHAWQILEQAGKTDPWHLVIAGWGDPPDEAALNAVFDRLQLQAAHCLGPLFGADKAAALAGASGFVLVSHGEALPVAMLEAWAWALPAVLSRQCNFPKAFELGAALEAQTEPAAMAAQLHRFMQLSEAERSAMGRKGNTYVRENFDWSQVAGQFHSVYDWLAHGAARPDCIDPGTR